MLPIIIIYVPGFYGDVEIVLHVVRILGRQREEISMLATSLGSRVGPGRRKSSLANIPGLSCGAREKKKSLANIPRFSCGAREKKKSLVHNIGTCEVSLVTCTLLKISVYLLECYVTGLCFL